MVLKKCSAKIVLKCPIVYFYNFLKFAEFSLKITFFNKYNIYRTHIYNIYSAYMIRFFFD